MKSLRIIFAMIALMALPAAVYAASYTFAPYDSSGDNDIFDLDHNYMYIWGINAPNTLKYEKIDSVTLKIANINNWDTNWNLLKFYLLDNPNISDNDGAVDIISIYDGSGTVTQLPFYKNKNKFTDSTKLDYEYSDTNGVDLVDQISYSFNSDEIAKLSYYLTTSNPYGKNATFGIGLDPDCHFFNDGITLEINTSPVPEPGTILLLGAGLIGLAGFGQRRRS